MTNTTTDGPSATADAAASVKVEQNPRWIRGKTNGRTVVDSRDSLFVWEVRYYPQWYFPRTAVAGELRRTGETRVSDNLGTATVYDIVLAGDDELVLEAAALVYEDSPVEAIRDRVRIRWNAIDTWLEEEVEVIVHPRSPYTRVDVLPSARRVTVQVDGETVADSQRPYILYETGLPARYYLPMADVRSDLLTPTTTETSCPYKGVARYWDVTVNGTTHKDLVWGYDNPLPESAAVKDLVCFYNEKVDLTVDGEALPQPKTKFS